MNNTVEKQALTRMLNYWQAGQTSILPSIIEHTYQDVKKIAHRVCSHERGNYTLRPTALVNEAYIRFSSLCKMNWESRQQYYNAWAGIMKRVLIDRARAVSASKRGHEYKHTTLNEDQVSVVEQSGLLELIDALGRLDEYDSALRQVVELRYFGGLNIEEVAQIMKISSSSVKRKWKLAKAWLYREMGAQLQ